MIKTKLVPLFLTSVIIKLFLLFWKIKIILRFSAENKIASNSKFLL